ncbi:hypothetical protein RFI_16951, partial [Reticulomyxa filosa]
MALLLFVFTIFTNQKKKKANKSLMTEEDVEDSEEKQIVDLWRTNKTIEYCDEDDRQNCVNENYECEFESSELPVDGDNREYSVSKKSQNKQKSRDIMLEEKSAKKKKSGRKRVLRTKTMKTHKASISKHSRNLSKTKSQPTPKRTTIPNGQVKCSQSDTSTTVSLPGDSRKSFIVSRKAHSESFGNWDKCKIFEKRFSIDSLSMMSSRPEVKFYCVHAKKPQDVSINDFKSNFGINQPTYVEVHQQAVAQELVVSAFDTLDKAQM